MSLVIGNNNGRFPFSHSILINGEKNEPTLVDTGCGIEILRKIKKKFNISQIINSHTHPDHSAGNWLFNDSKRLIYVPEESFNSSGNIIALSKRFVEPGELAEYWINYVTKSLKIKDCKPTHSYNSETVFEFGEINLVPILTPGHTKDHYCFYEPDDKLLFAFDYDLTSFGPWYGHRESSISDFKKSINTLKGMKVETFISGHRGIISSQDVIVQLELFEKKFDERDNKIIDLLKNGDKTIDQLVEKAPIYGHFPYAEPLLRYWEGQMIEKHLCELEKLGKVVRTRNNKYSLNFTTSTS
ncbi:MAG: MBL fold metallo-hydrolase [Candidatus Hodarchaeales archaeon]